MNRVVYLLWGQYSDRSGEVFVGVYEMEIDAENAKELAEKFAPTFIIKIQPVEYMPTVLR